MTEHDDERAVSRRYRELPREEPPRALDEAILARAREAGRTVPAPLVPPTGRSRWYFPVAAAAILVLAVAVTWQIEREQPDGYVATAPEPATAPADTTIALAREARKEAVEQEAKKPAERRAQAPVPAVPAPAPRGASAPEPPASVARSDEAQPAPGARARSEVMTAQRSFAESPQQALERIARLRAEGRHEEADKALAEFRKRHPDFRIPPEMLERVERK